MSRGVDRARVLAYRVVAHGLDHAAARPEVPAVLELGVQDTPSGSARLALAARGVGEFDEPLTLAWTYRGAPHLHPTARIGELVPALWPLSDADALSRVSWQRSRLRDVGMDALAALTEVTTAMRTAVTGSMTKGVASAAVTEAVPGSLTAWCQPCGARHVFESLFRLAALPAGLRLDPDLTPAHLVPLAPRPPVPARAAGIDRLVHSYLRFLGPAGPAEVAAFLGSTPAQLRRVWPDDLDEVEVDGRAAWLPEAAVAAVQDAPPPRLVRLLPPSDPYLQARDREFLLPDKAARRALWPSLGAPGALLVDGELAGVWRPRASGRTLRITVTPFDGLAADDRASLADEAETVAAVRGATRLDLVVE